MSLNAVFRFQLVLYTPFAKRRIQDQPKYDSTSSLLQERHEPEFDGERRDFRTQTFCRISCRLARGVGKQGINPGRVRLRHNGGV